MTTPQKKTMKKEKKTPEYITFNVEQTKITSFELDYQAFKENYVEEYPEHLETDEEFENRCLIIWNMVYMKTNVDNDEINLEDADCDDDVDEDYVCDASHDFIQPIVDKYNKTCPKFKAYQEIKLKKEQEELERLRKEQEEKKKADEERKKKEDEAFERQRVDSIKHLEKRIAEMTKTLNELKTE
jgi:hypothetical protein